MRDTVARPAAPTAIAAALKLIGSVSWPHRFTATVANAAHVAARTNERPCGPVLWPLRPEYDREWYQYDRRNGEPQRRGQERRGAFEADPDREPRGAPDQAEHRERRALLRTRRHRPRIAAVS